jgi:hypothetical protein
MAGRQNGKVGSYNASMRPGIKPLTLVKNTRKHVTARRDPEILQVGSSLFCFPSFCGRVKYATVIHKPSSHIFIRIVIISHQ